VWVFVVSAAILLENLSRTAAVSGDSELAG
jgi:hypothetical protein